MGWMRAVHQMMCAIYRTCQPFDFIVLGLLGMLGLFFIAIYICIGSYNRSDPIQIFSVH
jgi:hypothetical protein